MSIKTKMQSLIEAANAETGKGDTDLTTAVQSLISESGAVELDTTLTQSGKAADAKATGDAINTLSEKIANLQTSGLTTAQVEALDGMFKVCAFSKSDVSAEYSAFKSAFGITDSGGGSGDPGDVDTGLPTGYTACNYIASDNNSYINTEYNLESSDIEILLDITTLSVTADYPICGNRNGTNGNNCFATGYYQGKFYAYSKASAAETNATTSETITGGTRYQYKAKYSYSENAKAVVFNDAEASAVLTANIVNSGSPVFVFYSGSGTVKSVVKLHSMKLYDSGVLAMDIVPCLDENSVPCLYDKVRAKTMYNVDTSGSSFNYEVA